MAIKSMLVALDELYSVERAAGKCMVYGSGHGFISFTVPMFSDFLKRNVGLGE